VEVTIETANKSCIIAFWTSQDSKEQQHSGFRRWTYTFWAEMGSEIRVTKLHTTILKTQIGHRTFRVHAILVFFGLIDVNITEFIWCVNLRYS